MNQSVAIDLSVTNEDEVGAREGIYGSWSIGNGDSVTPDHATGKLSGLTSFCRAQARHPPS